MSKEIIKQGTIQSAEETEAAFHISFDKPLFSAGDDVEVLYRRTWRWHKAQVLYISLEAEFMISDEGACASGYGWRYHCEVKDPSIKAHRIDAFCGPIGTHSIRPIAPTLAKVSKRGRR